MILTAEDYYQNDYPDEEDSDEYEDRMFILQCIII